MVCPCTAFVLADVFVSMCFVFTRMYICLESVASKAPNARRRRSLIGNECLDLLWSADALLHFFVFVPAIVFFNCCSASNTCGKWRDALLGVEGSLLLQWSVHALMCVSTFFESIEYMLQPSFCPIYMYDSAFFQSFWMCASIFVLLLQIRASDFFR